MSPDPTNATKDLLYAIDPETNELLFAPRRLAEEIRLVRQRLNRCGTWGQARAELPENWFGQLVERHLAPTDQPPQDDHPLPEDIRTDDWPALSTSQTSGYLPHQVLALGHRHDTMLDSGTSLDADDQDEILQRLSDAGYNYNEDLNLPSLFEAFES